MSGVSRPPAVEAVVEEVDDIAVTHIAQQPLTIVLVGQQPRQLHQAETVVNQRQQRVESQVGETRRGCQLLGPGAPEGFDDALGDDVRLHMLGRQRVERHDLVSPRVHVDHPSTVGGYRQPRAFLRIGSQRGQQVRDQVAVGVDEADALVGADELVGQGEQEGRLPHARLASDVEMGVQRGERHAYLVPAEQTGRAEGEQRLARSQYRV